MLDFDVAKGDYSKLQGMNPFKSIAVPRPIGWHLHSEQKRG